MDRQSLVCGLGRNDAEYNTAACPFYRRWYGMLSRCATRGCALAPEWRTFSAFRAWMIAQPWEGNQLDKDLLFLGNRVYGPTTCCFIPASINAFITASTRPGGGWPVGVSCDGKAGGSVFIAWVANPFTRRVERLSPFSTPEEAHEAWRERKHQHACRYADMQTDPRIAQALRTRYA